MDEVDVNKDGYIDYTEFITAAVNKAVILNEDNLEAAFRMIDTDSSGTISIKELQDAFDSHGEKDPALWENIMKEVDKNGDNLISLDEFKDAMKNYLKLSQDNENSNRMQSGGSDERRRERDYMRMQGVPEEREEPPFSRAK